MWPRLIEMPFYDAGEALSHQADGQAEICNAGKKPEETQSANCLKRMARLLNDGARATHNARIVLQTFCERAYPVKQESIEHAINVEAADPLRELERSIDHLTKLVDPDGVMDHTCKRGPSPTARDWTAKRQKTATTNVAAEVKEGKMIERKDRTARRVTNRQDTSRFAILSATSVKARVVDTTPSTIADTQTSSKTWTTKHEDKKPRPTEKIRVST
ncbi:hypothetical protein PHYBOEH_008330 [Phytophthora boehmeriae]|uniref:Uncharacterized protein n=1 Tax=Phytophthora boehmeriae TaxID=109152 RepID=A0A8T1W520_9STRA|nr:hypothetical protein PHYBOEH_008330 [Phytophthora boehmeriae]